MLTRSVAKVVQAIEQSEGVNARVRRAIGGYGMRNFSPFLMLDVCVLNSLTSCLDKRFLIHITFAGVQSYSRCRISRSREPCFRENFERTVTD